MNEGSAAVLAFASHLSFFACSFQNRQHQVPNETSRRQDPTNLDVPPVSSLIQHAVLRKVQGEGLMD